jgi:hypothetical protein
MRRLILTIVFIMSIILQRGIRETVAHLDRLIPWFDPHDDLYHAYNNRLFSAWAPPQNERECNCTRG